MVSEKKSNLKIGTIVCCDEIVKTSYCPHCGTSKSKIVIYPQRFTVGFHTKKKVLFENHLVYIESLGISEDIKVEYELTEKNGDINLISLSDGIDQFRLVNITKPKFH